MKVPGPGPYLASGEAVVLAVRRHLAVLALPLLVALAAMFLASAVGYLTSPKEGGDLIDTLVGLVAIAAVARFAWRLWEWWADRIYVTEQRIFEVSGVLTRKVASMPLERVTDMTYSRSVLGRLLGFGELALETAGQDQGLTAICYLPHPDDFYRQVTSLVMGGVARDEGRRERFFPHPDEEDTGPLPRVMI